MPATILLPEEHLPSARTGVFVPRFHAAPREQGMGGGESFEIGLSDHAQPLARFPDARVLLLTAKGGINTR
jgi:hypothetical protein